MGEDPFGNLAGAPILRRIADRIVRLQHVDETDLPVDPHFAEAFYRPRIGQKHVVAGLNALFRIGQPGRMCAGNVTHADKHDGFVEG
ncbi:hypothetical protein D3C79_662260 [compost metagenome]